ncbi:hypothetical protein LCGC14_1326230 [marine sediment metagenome]|uniref:Uncharacterized protein n=1 Tax=marine sediment metagenome TaxID=412755 RepID=A0A0F9NKG2_9ZZZZ
MGMTLNEIGLHGRTALEQRADSKAFELGAQRISGGINWIWAVGFSTEGAAKEFVLWLEGESLEHRGVYPNLPRDEYPGWAVRYRS